MCFGFSGKPQLTGPITLPCGSELLPTAPFPRASRLMPHSAGPQPSRVLNLHPAPGCVLTVFLGNWPHPQSVPARPVFSEVQCSRCTPSTLHIPTRYRGGWHSTPGDQCRDQQQPLCAHRTHHERFSQRVHPWISM